MFRNNFVSREPADSLHSVGNQFRFSFLFLKTFFNVDLFFFFFFWCLLDLLKFLFWGFFFFLNFFFFFLSLLYLLQYFLWAFFFFKCFVLARRPVES